MNASLLAPAERPPALPAAGSSSSDGDAFFISKQDFVAAFSALICIVLGFVFVIRELRTGAPGAAALRTGAPGVILASRHSGCHSV